MDSHLLKITYHFDTKKIIAYLRVNSPILVYDVLKKKIEMYLFEERKLPRCEIRTFWIDEDFDEIEINNDCDYDIFMAKRPVRQHLHFAPIGMAEMEDQPNFAPAAAATKTSVTTTSTESASSQQAQVPPAAGSYDFAVHEHVECDACLMAPIRGFRYKCIQCPNYDLCQNCESKHIHSEHMMVRMPTNNCPNVIEAYVTGRTSRRHGKRSKTSCPFVKNGISVVIDDEPETAANATRTESADQSLPANGKEQRHHGRKHHRLHHRNNFFSHLYEMMHDLAEGGGAAAAAHAMGESMTSTKSSTSSTGPKTTTTTSTTATNVPVFENQPTNNISAQAAAAAAHLAAQKAHESAIKTAEIAAQIAHESAVQAAKNVSENMASTPSTSSSANAEATATVGGKKEKEATKEKVDATTSPRDPEHQPNAVPVMPSPSLESFAQYLDPQYMKTGIQILNNFSDMFAKMLDPLDNIDGGENQIYPNLRKNSTTSTKSSDSSNLNSLDSDKKSASEKLIEKEQQQNQEQTMEAKQTESDASSHVEIDDLGSDSENDSVSDSFIKLDVPKKDNMGSPSSYKGDEKVGMDFAQLSSDLKAHIAQEAEENDSSTTVETPVKATSDSPDSSETTSTITTPNKPEEKRAVPVYHADQRINNAVLAMMSMGFSNEGAWLTQLLESVNGNIPEALDLMSVAQRGGSR